MSAAPPAELRVDGPLVAALEERSLAHLGDSLIRFLMARRWFGGKGAAPKRVAVRDVTPLFPGTAVARIDVQPAAGGRITYQLPLAVRPEGSDVAGAATAVLARVVSSSGAGILFDAVEDPDFLAELGRAFESGAEFAGRNSRWIVSSAGRPFRAPRLTGAEQSNTSIFFGSEAMLKFYRRLAAGVNPDCEIGERLTRIGFRHVPALLGTIRFHDRGGETSIAGMVQALVAARGDGWSHALERFREEVGGGGKGGVTFAAEARKLGSITRELHEALASFVEDPDFAPIPVTAEDLSLWRRRVEEQVERALGMLATFARSRSAGPLSDAIERCRARRQQVLAHVAALVASLAGKAGARIRHHGQVLRPESGGFVIIDFEGEPARPIAERREKKSPLRDVAGMLRSFSYVASVGARQAREGGAQADVPSLERRAREWDEGARAEFQAGYLEKQPLPSFLPPTPSAVRQGTALFELEKIFYELEYELDNRPDWVEIPLAGIDRLLG
jgi:maltose alpha-D-glucosyltransferase/alpha-amylase